MRTAERTFWITVAVVTAIALTAAGAGVMSVLYVQRTWGNLALARYHFDALGRKRGQILDATRVAERLAPEIGRIGESFVDQEGILPLVEALEDLGRRSGVEMEKQIGSDRGGKVDEFSLSATGSFSNVMGFFERLESLPYLVNIGNVEVVRIATERGEAPVRFYATFRLMKP
jgi:hypothetical protein